jgi:uncharacterized MAPEG superfamily protein
LTSAPQGRLDLLAIVFVVARIVYVVCYLVDWHWARSLVWTISFVTCVVIFLSGVAPG